MKTLIFAHRGASKYAPENTMPAFELAYQQGAEGIETDVQLTKDHIPVLIHDERINRVTNKTGFVMDYTYDQLHSLDVGSWFGSQFTNVNIISLDTFLQWAKPKDILINLELKTNKIAYKGIEPIVYQLIKKYDMLDRIILSSFNHETIVRCKEIDSSLTTAFITSTKRADLAKFANQLHASGLHIKYRLLTRNQTKMAAKSNLYTGCYTVNRPHQMMRCFKLKCYNLFTDKPDLALKTRKLYEENIIY